LQELIESDDPLLIEKAREITEGLEDVRKAICPTDRSLRFRAETQALALATWIGAQRRS